MQRNVIRQVSTRKRVHFLLCSSNQLLHDIYVSLSFKSALHSGGEAGSYQNHPGSLFKQHQSFSPALPPPPEILPKMCLWTWGIPSVHLQIGIFISKRAGFCTWASNMHGGREGAETNISAIIFQLNADMLKNGYVYIFWVIYSGG